VIEAVPRPRKLVIEEGPLADWLYRNLSPRVDEIIVCDPHRNALISKDGDKSDALDWRKLAALHRGGFTKAVHQSGLAGAEPVQAARAVASRSGPDLSRFRFPEALAELLGKCDNDALGPANVG
jgi:hypothetical protein